MGASKGYFEGAKGLRQGDPLSPYMFSIVMDILSDILNDVPKEFNYHWRCKQLKINHLFFADDVILLSSGKQQSIDHLMVSMIKFKTLSGLSPSVTKSTCFFSNCSTTVTDWFNLNYGIPQGKLPVKFLGVPLISSKLSFNDCAPLIEKVVSRINSWTCFVLSFMGRLQLVKAVITAIIHYWSKHFILPTGVLKKIQSVITRFLWK